VFLAVALCFWPAVLLNHRALSAYWVGHVVLDNWTPADFAPSWAVFAITLALLTAGTFLLPAVLLTTTTSGTILNLRPDRVLAVIRNSGGRYVSAFLSGLLVVGLYAWILFGPAWLPEHVRETKAATFVNGSTPRLVIYLLAAYLTNWFCWQLGTIYGENEMKFAWVLQRHIPTKDRERMGLPDLSPRARAAARRRMRREQRQPQASGGR
jgi:hypothetical protein